MGYCASIEEGVAPGGTGGTRRDLSVRYHADELDRWVDTVGSDGPDSAILVHHDIGGGEAEIVVLRCQGRERGLALTNCVCYASWPVARPRRLRMAAV